MYSRDTLVLLVAFAFVFQMGASAPACDNRTDANQTMPTSARCCNGTCHDGGDVAKCQLDADCAAKHVCSDGKCIAYRGASRNTKIPSKFNAGWILFIVMTCFVVFLIVFLYICQAHSDCPMRKDSGNSGPVVDTVFPRINTGPQLQITGGV